MPTDLVIDPSLPPVLVRDRAGTGLPFSKGLMATSILATGVDTMKAHQIASLIEAELCRRQRPEIGIKTVFAHPEKSWILQIDEALPTK